MIGLCGHVLQAMAGQRFSKEKALIEAAGRMGTAPPGFSKRAQTILGWPGHRLRDSRSLPDGGPSASGRGCRSLEAVSGRRLSGPVRGGLGRFDGGLAR